MPVESTIGISLAQLKALIAESETFALAVGGEPDDVMARVHFGRQSGSPLRPFALVELESGDANAISFGAGNTLLPEGSLVVRFERDAVLSDPDPYLEAADWISRVIDDIKARAGTEHEGTEFGQTHLPLLTVSLTRLGENERATWHSLGRFFSAQTLWTWGDT